MVQHFAHLFCEPFSRPFSTYTICSLKPKIRCNFIFFFFVECVRYDYTCSCTFEMVVKSTEFIRKQHTWTSIRLHILYRRAQFTGCHFHTIENEKIETKREKCNWKNSFSIWIDWDFELSTHLPFHEWMEINTKTDDRMLMMQKLFWFYFYHCMMNKCI